MADSTIKAFNRMSAKALKESMHNAPLKLVKNPNTGKIFFTCGEITGYCSPAVQRAHETVTLDELQFAEVAKDGIRSNAIPCLMMAGNSEKNVVRSL